MKDLEQNSPLRPAIEIMEGVGGLVWRADKDRWFQKGRGMGSKLCVYELDLLPVVGKLCMSIMNREKKGNLYL